jgi:3D (Asp-Asp-Asp) domain-containing protein
MTRRTVQWIALALSLAMIAVALFWEPEAPPAPYSAIGDTVRIIPASRGDRPVDVLRAGQGLATPTPTVMPAVMPAAIPTPSSVSLGLFKITAYSNWDAGMDGRGITRSGQPTRWGIVAVDPRVIPLGTALGIEGMEGAFEAADTGGQVRGKHLDVWFPSRAEALRHGVQEREVWRVER